MGAGLCYDFLMYIRETKTHNKKTGKTYVKYQLVESFRAEKGPRQRVIMDLGSSLSLSKQDRRELAAILEERLSGQSSFFAEKYPELAGIADEAMRHYNYVQSHSVPVLEGHEDQLDRELVCMDLNSLGSMQHRSMGSDLVGHVFWNRLGFDEILTGCDFSERDRALAQAVIVGRLVAPSSDLATCRWFKDRSALIELLQIDLSKIGKDAFYEIADKIWDEKARIEAALKLNEDFLFPGRTTLYLYDLTNTYFEGSCLTNELAKRGHCKQNRTDCPLVTLALVIDKEGFAITSRIYGGNQSEPQTLEEILQHLYPESEQGSLFLPTIVMDRGIATKDNLALLKEKGYPYLLIERRNAEKEYVKEFEHARDDFEVIKDKKGKTKVYVKKLDIEEGTRVLCLSDGREAKEEAIDELKERRFLEDLGRLAKSVAKGNIKLKEKVGERVGRLKERYPRIAPHYEIILNENDDKTQITEVLHEKKDSRRKKQTVSGCYVIETSHKDLEAQEIWHLYMTLTRVEDSFRSLKDELGVRPIYHQNADRTKAHLFVSVLAYHLLNAIEKTLQTHGDQRTWASIREILSTHQRSTIVFKDDQGMIHHTRLSSTPESQHKEIYERLDIKDPLKRKHVVLE
jgi:transposase